MNRKFLYGVVALIAIGPVSANATHIPLTIKTTLADDYVIVGMAPGSFGTTVNINSFELGQITAPLPSSAPTLPGNALAVPVPPVFMGGGNVAITHETGTFNFQNVEVSATTDLGIQCAGMSCNDGSSGSVISFDAGASYDSIPANGVTNNADLSALTAEIEAIRNDIADLTTFDGTIDLQVDGKISGDRTDVFNDPGLNVIYIDTGDNDFLLEAGTWVIDGVPGASVVFVFDTAGKNFKLSNANIAAGTGGIGLDSILFAALDTSGNSGTKFDFSNSLLNGVSFWDLSGQNNVIGLNNVAGCTQFVGDRVDNLNNVSLKNCAFASEGDVSVPEPTTLSLLGFGLAGIAWIRRRKLA